MASVAALATCPGCGSELPPRLLSCPGCHRLVHAARLQALAAEAQQAQDAGDAAGALGRWREALDLLPAGTRQREQVAQTVAELSARVDTAKAPEPPPGWLKKLSGPAAVAGIFLWKFKAAVLFVLTKGKLLLLGLTKGSTFFSMLLSLGVYWAAWGWAFALGLVLSIYVHEMGHVFALQRFGIKATPPMFIPGFGALVRLEQYPATPAEDARVGLAGPRWGLYAALFCAAVFFATRAPFWAALAVWGARINLFNLAPLWQLDGGRGFRALTQVQRFLAVAACGLALFLTAEHTLGLLIVCGLLRAFAGSRPEQGDTRSLAEYAALVAALSALTLIPVTLPH